MTSDGPDYPVGTVWFTVGRRLGLSGRSNSDSQTFESVVCNPWIDGGSFLRYPEPQPGPVSGTVDLYISESKK